MGVMEAPEKEKDTLGTLNTEEGVRGASLDALGNAEGLEGAPEPRFTRKAVMGASSPWRSRRSRAFTPPRLRRFAGCIASGARAVEDAASGASGGGRSGSVY